MRLCQISSKASVLLIVLIVLSTTASGVRATAISQTFEFSGATAIKPENIGVDCFGPAAPAYCNITDEVKTQEGFSRSFSGQAESRSVDEDGAITLGANVDAVFTGPFRFSVEMSDLGVRVESDFTGTEKTARQQIPLDGVKYEYTFFSPITQVMQIDWEVDRDQSQQGRPAELYRGYQFFVNDRLLALGERDFFQTGTLMFPVAPGENVFKVSSGGLRGSFGGVQDFQMYTTGRFDVTVRPVSAPATLGVLGLGVLMLVGFARCRRERAALS